MSFIIYDIYGVCLLLVSWSALLTFTKLIFLSKKQLFISLIFSKYFFFSITLTSLTFLVYFLLLFGGFFYSFFFFFFFSLLKQKFTCFCDVRIQCYKFHSQNTALAASYICQQSVSFLFTSLLFISFGTSFLTHELFRSMLINLQFKDFFHCHSVAGFYFDSVVIREHTLYDSKCFNFAEVCLMAKNMVYLGGFHRHWKKVCILLLLDTMQYVC